MLFPDAGAKEGPDWQQCAAALAALNYFTIISGGPGTGKTTTVVRLLLLLTALDPARRVIELCAPTGKAAARTVASFVEQAPLAGHVFSIRNDFFGGNVDVTGLMCVCDILAQLPEHLNGTLVVVPNVMFNADGLTLDSSSQLELEQQLTARGARVLVSSTLPYDLLEGLEAILIEA